MTGGPLEGMGPEFARGVVVLVPNTGSFTLPASDLMTLMEGTEATELMVGATQVVAQSAQHDGKSLRILLRNGERIVLHVR
jgi:L-cysteine desulfidase